MIGFKYILLLAVVAFNCEAANLPTYVEKCCMDDSINNCLMDMINRALKYISLGDNYYNTPGFYPLRIPKVEVFSNSNGNFTVSNIRVYGFPQGTILYVNFNVSAGTYNARYNYEKLVIDANYDIYVSNTPVVGFGSAEISLRNVTIDHSFQVQVDNDGYARIRNPTANYNIQSTTYEMQNMNSTSNDYMNANTNALNVIFKSQVNKAFSDVLSWTYIALTDLIKLADVIDFSCTGTTTSTTTPTTTPTTTHSYNLTLPTLSPTILNVTLVAGI